MGIHTPKNIGGTKDPCELKFPIKVKEKNFKNNI